MARWVRRCVAISALFAVAGFASGAAGAAAPPSSAVSEDADWILSAQLPDGSIATSTDRAVVVPYVSNLAAIGLADAALVTGRSTYALAAWRAVAWYATHEDASGFVTDYRVVDGALVSTGDMDSTDAYAGTFLLAVREIWRASPDIRRLRDLAPGLRGAVDAIAATRDADGLTWAKPSWRVKYLMDQAETYAGLLAAAQLFQVLNDGPGAERATTMAQGIKLAVDALWNPGTQSHDWAVHGDGTRVGTDWSILYPDSIEQAWAVAFGLVDGPRAAATMQQFASRHPEWSSPRAMGKFADGVHRVGYWAAVSWAFRRVGATAAADAGVASIRSAAAAAARVWPFASADGGELVVAGAGVQLAALSSATSGASSGKRNGRGQ